MSVEAFETAAAQVKQLSGTPSNEEKLSLYKNYKQATVGDVTGCKIFLIFFII